MEEAAFDRLQQAMTAVPGLRYYNPEENLTVQSGASDTGLGAVLMQGGQPIAYVSRALTSAEKTHALIEKKLLAVVFGLDKNRHHTYGKRVLVGTNHKPLETIVKKPLYEAPRRLQRILLIRLQPYELRRNSSENPRLTSTAKRLPPPCERICVLSANMIGNTSVCESYKRKQPKELC